jgi:hypothetical protein
MSCKRRSCQIIEGPVTHSATIPLSMMLDVIVSIFNDFGGVAMGTFDVFGPTKLANHLVTLGVVDQSVNVKSHPA